MSKPKQNDQIVSRARVADHGEVYTGEREVNAMLDLVKEETERIDSRFLEPACGNGNFMVEILRRKLNVVTRRYAGNTAEWAEHAVCAVSSVYGIDILPDNVEASRRRLMEVFTSFWHRAKCNDNRVLTSAKFIIGRNILHGDALTLTSADGTNQPLVFSEWTFIGGGKVKRRDYELAELMRMTPMDGPNLFSDLGEEAFIPTPKQEFPNVNFLKLSDYDNNRQL